MTAATEVRVATPVEDFLQTSQWLVVYNCNVSFSTQFLFWKITFWLLLDDMNPKLTAKIYKKKSFLNDPDLAE